MSPGHWVGKGGASLETPCQWWGLSPRPLHVLLCVCPLLRAQCRGVGWGVGGGALVTRLGISPAGTAILQPLAGRGQAAGNTGDSQEA